MSLGPKLATNQLAAGDVLLLRDLSEGTHKLIAFGQSTLSHGWHRHANIVHAGLYDGGHALLEASGEGKGLRSGDFTNKERHYEFLVFRYKYAAVAYEAAQWAQVLIGERRDVQGGFGHYSRSGALGSLMHRSNLGTGGAAISDKLQKWAGNYDFKNEHTNPLEKIKEHTALYCSGFVVQCYVLATPRGSAPAISVDYRFVSPKRLEGELRKGGDWRHEGYVKAGEI